MCPTGETTKVSLRTVISRVVPSLWTTIINYSQLLRNRVQGTSKYTPRRIRCRGATHRGRSLAITRGTRDQRWNGETWKVAVGRCTAITEILRTRCPTVLLLTSKAACQRKTARKRPFHSFAGDKRDALPWEARGIVHVGHSLSLSLFLFPLFLTCGCGITVYRYVNWIAI